MTWKDRRKGLSSRKNTGPMPSTRGHRTSLLFSPIYNFPESGCEIIENHTIQYIRRFQRSRILCQAA